MKITNLAEIESSALGAYANHKANDLAECFVYEGWLAKVSDKLGRDIILNGNYHETKIIKFH